MEDERPVAVTIEFLPRVASHTAVPCDAVELTRFMYVQGYVYEDMQSLDEMLDAVRGSIAGSGMVVFEGWWRLRVAT
jgi:hypothetical protein